MYIYMCVYIYIEKKGQEVPGTENMRSGSPPPNGLLSLGLCHFSAQERPLRLQDRPHRPLEQS